MKSAFLAIWREEDRRKIDRTPEGVIKIRVIEELLLTSEEFEALQRAMELKQKKPLAKPCRLRAPLCVQRVPHLHRVRQAGSDRFARNDYYICKGRRMRSKCQAKYIARERLRTRSTGYSLVS